MVKLHSKDTNKTRSWDDPNGLGWELWRRAHSTGLSSAESQRAIGPKHANTLVARTSLMADIHRRWGLNQGRAGGGYSLSFPLVVARFPLFYPDTQHQNLSFLSRPLGRPTAAAVSVSASGRSRLSKTAKRSEVLATGRTEQPAQAMDTGFAQHGSNMHTGLQRPGGSDGFKGYDGFEGSDRTLADQTSGSALSLQRSKPAAEVNTTQNDTARPIEAPRSGAATQVNLQRSARPALSKSAPAPATAEATSQKNTPETKLVASMHPYGRRTSPSIANQNTPSSPSTISRGNQSYMTQPFLEYSGSNLLAKAIWQHQKRLPHSERKSTVTPSTVAGQKDAVVSRSKAGIASELGQFEPVALYSGTSKTPLYRKFTDRLERVRGGDEPMPVILRSPAGGTASTSTAPGRQRHRGDPLRLHDLKPAAQEDSSSSSSPQTPYPLPTAQAAHFSNTPLSRSVSSGPRKGTALTVAAASDRRAMHPGTSSRQLPGHRNPIAFLTHRSHLQASPLTGSRVPVAGNKVSSASPLLYSMPAASLRKASPFAKENLSHLAGGRNAAPAALMTMSGMVTTSPGRGMARRVRQSDRIETASHGDNLLFRVVTRAPAIGTTLTDFPSGRQAQHKDIGRNHVAYDTEAVAGRSGMPQLIEPLAADRATLYRQQDHPAERHLKFNTQADGGTGRGVGQPRWAPGTTSLTQLHQDRLTHRHPDAFEPIAGTGPFLATRGPASLLRMAAKTPYGAMRLPLPAPNVVQRHVAGHTKGIKNGFPLSSIKDSGSALSAVGRTGAAAAETNGDTSSLRLNFSVDPLNTSFSGFESGHHLFRRPVGQPMVMQAVAKWEASRAAGTDRRPDKSSDWRPDLLRQAVYPGLRLRPAAGKDTRSGGPATPAIATPIGAFPITGEFSGSFPFQLPSRRSEASPAPLMDKSFHEMPLFYKSAANTPGGTSPDQRLHRSVAPTRPVQLQGSDMTPAASVFEPQRVREAPAASETQTATAGARMDTDELVEKIWQKIMRKLTIEQERRGCPR